MRSDRAVTLYLAQPIVRLLPRRVLSLPILMYHRVPDADDCARHPYYCTNTAAGVFERQIRWLRENGYHGVTVSEAARLVSKGAPAEKTVAITFDDGYRNFYTHAFPVLKRYEYAATMFLPTAYIGDAPQRFKGDDCLTWPQVRELRRAGVEFGSHTVTHPQLRAVGAGQLRHELRASKTEMEQRLGEAVETFAYPYAFPETDRSFVAGFCSTLRECGYRAGVSTVVGRAAGRDNPFYMRRLPVNSHDDPSFFRAKLEGAYDWLHGVQYAAKLRTGRRRPLTIL